MKKPAKIFLGIATLWPIIYMFLFFIFIFSQVFTNFSTPESTAHQSSFPGEIKIIFGLHFFTMLWIFGLLAIYIINVFKNDRVTKDKKALWAVVLFLGNMFAMPIYWYLYIWREPKETI